MPLNRASPIKVVLRRNLGERRKKKTPIAARFISVLVGITNYTEHYVKCAFVIARLPLADKGCALSLFRSTHDGGGVGGGDSFFFACRDDKHFQFVLIMHTSVLLCTCSAINERSNEEQDDNPL